MTDHKQQSSASQKDNGDTQSSGLLNGNGVETEEAQQAAEQFRSIFNILKAEIRKFMVGQEDVIDNVLNAIICGGHVLLEGVPGLGKTALVHTIARALHLSFKRIQFTPDLLPSDIVGSNILIQRGGQKIFQFEPGPVFCNILLADEINRATPKTQSALLETMQEKNVTVSGVTHPLSKPFFVLATQNPIEQDGTYPLPEAQLDRFFFKLHVEMPNHSEFAEILRRTGGITEPEIEPVATGDEILRMGRTVRYIPIEEGIQDYLIRVVRLTHPRDPQSPEDVKKYVRHGASPRAAQTILAAARVRALLSGRYHVAIEDIDAVSVPAMRHRLILSFEGEAEGITPDQIIRTVINAAAL
ncbi:MAG: MoxR family ATPase [Sedimentisphaerales bacterium]|nr:MoxR family ATPase [Sedimentisphaerales bacterium]